jgi:hypothetical protein
LPCRFQEISPFPASAGLAVRGGRARVLSGGRRIRTGALYDLCTSRGQIVDKKGAFSGPWNYPQVHPHPQGQFYRGFRCHFYLYKQQHRLLLNEIRLYHHHIALDLYTDLKLGRASFASSAKSLGSCSLETGMARHYADAPRETSYKKPRHGGRGSAVPRETLNRVRGAAASPRDATSRCSPHAPAQRNSSRAAG